MNRFTRMFSFALWIVAWSLCSCATPMNLQPVSDSETPIRVEPETNGTYSEDKEWTPEFVGACLKAAQPSIRVELLRTVNPFYLRLNFDNTEESDAAVLVREPEKGIEGLLLCSDSKEPFLIGASTRNTDFVSTFPMDDFVTHRWEALSRGDTQSISPSPRFKELMNAKPPVSESVGFFFDGGAVFVYRSRDSYVVIEGG